MENENSKRTEISPSQSTTAENINNFPDDILTHILSFLPIKQAFRTTILSKRWLSLCHSLSILHFDNQCSKKPIYFCRVVNAIMFSPHSHHITLKSLHLGCRYKFWDNDDCFHFNKWMEEAKRRRVEELNLSFLLGFHLSPTIFCCTTLVVLKLKSLRVATMFDCSFHLPLLKTLNLIDVCLNDMEDLKKLIYECPMLEDLKTSYVKASVGITAGRYSKPLSNLIKANIRLFDVPLTAVSNVQFLTVTGMGQSLRNEEINSYYKGYPVFENLIELQLFWFNHCIHDWDDVVTMLHNCPKLQALSISKWTNSSTFGVSEDWKYPFHVPECVSSHLTTCKIIDYRAIKADFRFATYILQNARLLQVMTICHDFYQKSSKRPQFFEELSSCPRISPACKLSFSKSY